MGNSNDRYQCTVTENSEKTKQNKTNSLVWKTVDTHIHEQRN